MLDSPSSRAPLPNPGATAEAGDYVISGFMPADAPDIPRGFKAVYGKDYVNPLVYDADAFASVVSGGQQFSFVARDAKGDFAGHLALAFSAPNSRLVEVCQGIVLPAHRKSGIFARLMERAVIFARDDLLAQAVFGTALANHVVSQRVLAACGFRDYGLEVDYAPQRLLRREGADGPAAILLQYLDFGRNSDMTCYLPPSYAVWFARLLNNGPIAGQCQITLATGLDRRASVSEAKDMPRFDMARLLVRRAGFDFWSLVGEAEAEAEAAGCRSFQVLINLGNPEGAAAVELLRGWGYACSGLLPGYLEGGQHVAIMYRNFAPPYFQGIQLHDAGAERLLAAVVTDWQRAERLGAELRQVFDGEPAAAPALSNLTPQQDEPATPLETTQQLLGIAGRVKLESGGMVPVDIEEDQATVPQEPPPVSGDPAEPEATRPKGKHRGAANAERS